MPDDLEEVQDIDELRRLSRKLARHALEID
jgi:hypothetical protein